MTGLAIGALALLLVGVLMWFARKGGKDSVKAKAAEKTIEQVKDAMRPFSDPDLERVRQKFLRRD